VEGAFDSTSRAGLPYGGGAGFYKAPMPEG
jgi:hypothetical protein